MTRMLFDFVTTKTSWLLLESLLFLLDSGVFVKYRSLQFSYIFILSSAQPPCSGRRERDGGGQTALGRILEFGPNTGLH
jgi:hypothetical protein